MNDVNAFLETKANSFLTNQFGESYLHAVNRNSFNQIGSEAVFQRYFDESIWDEDTLNVIIGTDSGLLVEFIQKKGVPDGSRFLFIELPLIIDSVVDRLKNVKLEKQIAICGTDNWKEAAQDFSFGSYVYLEKVRLLQSIGAADAYIPAYRELFRITKSNLDIWIWGLRGHLGSKTFIACQLQNVAEDHIPAQKLKGCFSGKTAVVLGGGPSLDDLLPWVREHRNEIVIIAVSRICRQLIKEKLNPHIVVSIDPTQLSFDISKELLIMDEHILFVNSYHVVPPLLSQWKGYNVYLGERLPWACDLNEENIEVGGPTVTNTAINLAVEMGFSQVVLGGVDLCFSPEGFTHATGSNEYAAGPMLGHHGHRVQTNSGQLAETEDSLEQAIHDIGQRAAYALASGCTIINPGANAASIDNVEYRPVDKITIQALDEPAEKLLFRILPTISDTDKQVYYRKVIQELEKVLKQLREIHSLAKEALHCNIELFTNEKDFKNKLQMDKIESKLNTRFKKISPLVKNFGIRSFIRIVRPADKEWLDEDIERTGKIYYEAYRDGAKNLSQEVENAIHRMHSRIEELKPEPDIKNIIEQWTKDNQPGRIHVWEQHHPDVVKQYGHLKHQFEEQRQKFASSLTNDHTSHHDLCNILSSLTGISSKAILLFQNKDITELKKILNGLEHHTSDLAPSYQSLIQGYIYELQEDHQKSLECFQKIDKGPLVEDSLRRICSISLNNKDYESALLALDCLSLISPYYKPMYAELLKILGDSVGASNKYADYLEEVPNDIPVLLKLGQLYKEQGIIEGARWIYTHILEQDPRNSAAQTLLNTLDVPQKVT